VWPFDRSARTDVLRVCRAAVEHWTPTPAGLALHRREPLERPMEVVPLEDAIVRLFANSGTPVATPRRVDAVIESAWLPVMLLAPGTERRQVAAIEALLRERLAALYDTSDDPVARWQLRIDGLPGDRQVRGYGLPMRMRECMARGLSVAGVEPASLQPAWAWALAHASQRATRRHTGWWFWQESDRTLLAGLARGRVVSLHPALAPMGEHFDPRAAAAAEAARTGLELPDSLIAGGWHAPVTPAGGASWSSVASAALPAKPATTRASTIVPAVPQSQPRS
jgi:hypothetical protein